MWLTVLLRHFSRHSNRDGVIQETSVEPLTSNDTRQAYEVFKNVETLPAWIAGDRDRGREKKAL